MDLDYSTFSISNALGTLQRSPATTITPRERSFAEQETRLPLDQAETNQNQHDVGIMSFLTRNSLNPTLQRQHFISPQHSFSHTSEDYVPPRSDFVHNTSYVHGYRRDCFQCAYPFVANYEGQQQADLIHSSVEIALAQGGQLSQDHTSSAVSSITHPTSPLFSLDSFGGPCSTVNYHNPVFHSDTTDHVSQVSFPITDFDWFHSLTMQENTAGVYPLHQLNNQVGQQLDVTDGSSAELFRSSHDVRTSTQLPPRFHSVDPPRIRVLGKRLRRTFSDSQVADRDVESNSLIKRAVPASYAARCSVHLDAQHAKVNPRMEISRTASRKVECDGRMVDECAVQKAIESGQPLLHVYECQWDKNHSPCWMYIEGDQSSVTDHLLRFHNFTGGEGDTACVWDGCLSKKRAAMKGTSIARHLVTHIGYKVKCTTCLVVFAREDACRRSHSNARSDCRNMQIDPVHGSGVIGLKVQDCEPVAKKRRRADS
ncbi:hypothetical protein AZE42_02510 [Rhizopogon vesiculosus]|uniref:Uncharacterized protein n=1 Tax=Rhizopogon vesiculosus TaxID=180088 RepID=A0A1J8RGA6_9AGAM|nr:hypothetical protein AZE42_02510 [Rhizopogon vesiculosus]